MSGSFWVLGNARSPIDVTHVCSSETTRRQTNPLLPAYMQPNEYIPVVLSFSNRPTAMRFLDKRLHESTVHQNNLTLADRPFITYATNQSSSTQADYEIFPVLLTAKDTFLRNLVITSFSQFFVIESFNESANMVTLEGELIDPMNNILFESQLDVQHVLFEILEDLYESSNY
jgi:hypothetical protein